MPLYARLNCKVLSILSRIFHCASLLTETYGGSMALRTHLRRKAAGLVGRQG
jgi:hypothetical protein